MIKMLVLDLDGTTLISDYRISEENRTAIKSCRDKGVTVVFASGRSEKSMYRYIEECALEAGYHICNNGAYVFRMNGRRLSVPLIGSEDMGKIRDGIEAAQLPFVACTAEALYYENDNRLIKELTDHGEWPFYQIQSVKELKDAFKYILICRNNEEYARAKEIENDRFSVFRTSHDFVEIMAKGVNKFKAVKDVANILKIKISDIAAVGDSENDIPMIQGAGLGIAMKNAREETKKAANVILTWDNMENGVAKLIEKYII